MPETFWADDRYAGAAHLIRFGHDDGDPNDRLDIEATWPDGTRRCLSRIMSGTYRRTYGLDSAMAVAQTSAERIAGRLGRGGRDAP